METGSHTVAASGLLPGVHSAGLPVSLLINLLLLISLLTVLGLFIHS